MSLFSYRDFERMIDIGKTGMATVEEMMKREAHIYIHIPESSKSAFKERFFFWDSTQLYYCGTTLMWRSERYN